MGFFSYKVRDRQGRVREGVIEAAGEDRIIEKMGLQKLTVVHIHRLNAVESLCALVSSRIVHKEKIERDIAQGVLKPRQEISPRDALKELARRTRRRRGTDRTAIANFTRELAVLLKAGIPIDRALTIVAESESDNPEMKTLLINMKQDLQSGVPLVQAFSRHRAVFPSEYIGILKVGMETGKIAEALESLAEDLDREDRLYRRLRAALTYPAFVFGTAVTCNMAIFLYVFPQIASIFQGMKLNLPLCTKVMLFSLGTVRNQYFLAGAAAVLIIAYLQARYYFRTPVGRYNIGALKFLFPLIGSLNRKLFAEKLCRVLAMFYRYNIPISTTLLTVREIFDDPYLRDTIFDGVYEQVTAGVDLDVAFRCSPNIPRLVTTLTHVGIQTGDMTGSLSRAAQIFELEIDQTLQRLVVLIEPFIVSFLGFFILFAILSIFLPLYQVIANLGT
jgi:general secretion pathway protein F